MRTRRYASENAKPYTEHKAMMKRIDYFIPTGSSSARAA